MRKTYFFFASLFVATTVMAQTNKEVLRSIPQAEPKFNREKAEFAPEKYDFIQKSRNSGDTIPGMYWDFAGGFPADWTRADNSQGQIGGWNHTTQAPQGQFSTNIGRLNSTTRDNGYMILDGDFNNPGNPPSEVRMNAWMQTPVLDLTDYIDVKLHFQYAFRFCCNAGDVRMEVQISTDGGTTFPNIIDFREGIQVNIASANAINRNFNITNIVSGQSQVVIRFFVTGASHYYWMVDDVAVTQSADNDLVLQRRFVDFLFEDGGYFTQMPFSQADQITFRGRVFNNGANAQSGTKLNVTVNRGAQTLYDHTSATVNLNKLDTTILDVTQTYTPDAKGTYTVNFTASSSEQDQIPADNTLSASFIIGDTIFARDDGVLTGLSRYSTNFYVGGDVDGSIASTIYDCPKPGRIKSMSVYILNDANSIGTSFKAVVFPVLSTGIPSNPILESDLVDIDTEADMNKWHHVPFITDGVVDIIPDDGQSYLVGIQVFGVGPSNGNRLIVIGADRRTQQPLRTTYVFVAGTSQWGFTENGQPLIRLNLEDPETIGFNELSNAQVLLGQNIPNPAQNSSTIYYTLSDFTSANLEIRDISGKLIANHALGSKAAGKHEFILDTSNFHNGVYFYTLQTRYGQQTRRMIISK
ncbi:MAG: T9SS type A sorting domain-containing protein [Flavobacteriales bacterium]